MTAAPHLWNLQSEAMWPAPPHLVHTVVLVMLRVSELCQGLKILLKEKKVNSGAMANPPYFHRLFRSPCTPLLTDHIPVIIFPKGPIQASQLPKLHLPQIILVLRGLNTLLQNVSYLIETQWAVM